MKLSANFNLEDFIKSDTAIQKGISNEPGEVEKANIKYLVENILQPARTLLNMPIVIRSGFRSKELNAAVGGAATSQHCKGEAADIVCKDNLKLFNLIKDNFLFDQLINEYPVNGVPSWVHVSLKKNGNRKQILTIK